MHRIRYKIIAALGIFAALALLLFAIYSLATPMRQSPWRKILSDGEEAEIELLYTPQMYISGISADFIGTLVVSPGEPAFRLSGPERYIDSIRITEKDSVLYLTSSENSVGSSGVKAFLSVPEIQSLSIKGVINSTILDFTGDTLNILLEGASLITLKSGTFEHLSIQSTGVGKVTAEDFTTTSAHVVIDGASTIILSLDGGELNGEINGLGSIRYRGNVIHENITIKGLGSIRKLDS